MQSTNEEFSEHSGELEALYIKESRYGMIRWFMRAISNSADFDGRARRKEFWWFYLGFIVLNILAVMADDVITYLTGGFSGWARLVATLFLLLPMLSVTNRRLHDIGRSGSWQYLWFGPLLLLVLIFIIDSSIESETSDFIYGAIGVLIFSIAGGWVALLILMLFKTSPKINKWGAPAKRV